MTYEVAREQLISFLGTIARPGTQITDADDDTNLFDAGLIDSLALVQIIIYLEEHFDVSLRAHNIDPNDLASIGGILKSIEKSSR